MIVRCVVAGNGMNGPDFYFCKIECTQEEYDNGEHYKLAAEAALVAEAYDPDNAVVFDEHDGPVWLFEHFVWSTASVFCVDGEDPDED